jgi:lysophospholipase L1-like esterase
MPVRIAAATLLAGALGAVGALGSLATPAPSAAPRTILDLGDSLSVGTDPYLRPRLRAYRIERHYDVGLHAYDAATIVSGMERSLPSVLVVSAGTNDDPRIVSTFERAVSTIVGTAGTARCVVWPTIARPPAVGRSYDGLNRALTRAAGRHANLVLVGWAWRVRLHPRWLAADGVHVSADGYRARAAAIANAVTRRCGT